jgi:hypothetical protein
MAQQDTKSQKYFAVSRSILEIIEKDGPASLTHSRLSRQSKVSRAWIYEYMGKEKSDLIEIAAETFSSYFSKASIMAEISNPEDLKNHLINSQDQAFQKIKDEPIIIKLYFRFKGTSTPIGISINKYEKYWLDIMSTNFMRSFNLDQSKALTISRIILTLRLGLYHLVATSPKPTKELAEAREALDLIYCQML